MAKSFTGEQFAKALSEGTLKESIVRIGMVKPDEGGPSAILFAEGTSCAKWIKIPVDLIDDVELITKISCRDHEHPLVQIRFKEPPKENESARVFAELARQSTSPIQGGILGETPDLPLGSIAIPPQGGAGGQTPPCPGGICIGKRWECHVEFIRVGGMGASYNVPVVVCTWRCIIWECHPNP